MAKKIFNFNFDIELKIPVYWLITKKDLFLHNNKRNYEIFLQECSQEPEFMSYLLIFGIFGICIFALNCVIHCYTI